MNRSSQDIAKDFAECIKIHNQRMEVSHRMTKNVCSTENQEKGLDLDYINNECVTYSIISDVSVYADVIDYEFKKCISVINSIIVIDLSYLIYKIKKVMNGSDLAPRPSLNLRMFVDDKSLGYTFSLDVFVSYNKNENEVKCNIESYYKNSNEYFKLIDYRSDNTSITKEEGDEKSIITLQKKYPTIYKEK